MSAKEEVSLRIAIDPDLKNAFVLFCHLRKSTQKKYITICIQAAVDSIKKKD